MKFKLIFFVKAEAERCRTELSEYKKKIDNIESEIILFVIDLNNNLLNKELNSLLFDDNSKTYNYLTKNTKFLKVAKKVWLKIRKLIDEKKKYFEEIQILKFEVEKGNEETSKYF